MSKLVFELGAKGRIAQMLPPCDVSKREIKNEIPSHLIREDLDFPQLSEPEVVGHYVKLSGYNYGVDSGFYPLGSCTMKYNPKINEAIASLNGFAHAHPHMDDELSQGSLELLYNLAQNLAELTGMDEVTLQPSAGAQGELVGLMVMKAYLDSKGETHRNKVLIPDTAHGTNPASAMMAGLEVVEIKSNKDGSLDMDDLVANLDENIVGLMLTNPSTLGLFEANIEKIAQLVHEAGGLLYYDGANMNAIMGVVRPGDMGFDVVHLNLHKTMSTPHGGGGPGAGPVGVKGFLGDFLPKPIVVKDENGSFSLCYNRPKSIGSIRAFYGNFGILARAYTYILSLGGKRLKSVTENAVLNANYLKKKLSEFMDYFGDGLCMHEFIVTAQPQKQYDISALDIAKRMIDYGVHPPTIYFPLLVKESMMFEPTETVSKETLDEITDIMKKIIDESKNDKDLVKNAPSTTRVGRLDDTKAARKPVLTYIKAD